VSAKAALIVRSPTDCCGQTLPRRRLARGAAVSRALQKSQQNGGRLDTVGGEIECAADVVHRGLVNNRDRHRQTTAGLHTRRMEYRVRHQSFERLSCVRGLAILRCCAWAAGRLRTLHDFTRHAAAHERR
jgi:hypothetical protein